MAITPGRSELEVFVNNLGTITIRQADDATSGGEPLLEVHPDDISMLIHALDRARREAQRLAADERDEYEEVTMPELYGQWRSGSA
jgi:hypothetical protein